ncbi:MAG: hypothetical protein GBAus27B_000288 [Mycoplasmataceae bacterium]|nr:MAG: hypothetical protein GBAus27B_000288 [Mycoplasmataceae bacterium]
MNRTLINQAYYLKNKAKLQELRRTKYQSQKSQSPATTKKDLGDYYHANNIRVLISLKDYLDSSSDRMKLWVRFSLVLQQIKEGVSDIIEIMRLREVMNDLITDYWLVAKKDIRLVKKWNKLTPQQQNIKRKKWAEELENEEEELRELLNQQEQKNTKKSKLTRADLENFTYEEQIPKPKSKVHKEQCPDCGKFFKELDEENGICKNCLAQYE